MSDKILRMPSNWRPDGSHTSRLLHPGDYRVPDDWSEEFAARAIAAGVAVVVEDFTAKVKGKGRAPENKRF